MSTSRAVFVSIAALVVSLASAVFSYQSNQQAKRTHTHTVKSEFLDKFPSNSKSCFRYFGGLDNSIIENAVSGKSHLIRDEGQLERLRTCIPEVTITLKVNDQIPMNIANQVKDKVKKALGVLDHAASQLDATDSCDLAKELQGIMISQELLQAIEAFAKSGSDKNPNLFEHINRFRSNFGGANGLASVC